MLAAAGPPERHLCGFAAARQQGSLDNEKAGGAHGAERRGAVRSGRALHGARHQSERLELHWRGAGDADRADLPGGVADRPPELVGTGIASDETIAVSYQAGGRAGIALYGRKFSGRWEGVWTVAGSRETGTDVWIPHMSPPLRYS